jgi:hypothetical protein
MGCCQKKTKILDKKLKSNKADFNNSYKSINMQNEQEKINLYINHVFEDIKDVKNFDIKGMMLLNETKGRPKELYVNLQIIAQCNLIKLTNFPFEYS